MNAIQTAKKTVLVTGGAGDIGRGFAERYAQEYALRLMDRRPIESAPDGAVTITADISDAEAVRAAMVGVAAVVHLAGDPNTHASWDSALQNNIVGLHTVFDAAHQAGVKRIVYASSSHAGGAHVHEFGIAGPEPPARPDSIYGVSKVFGEALGSYYSDRLGLSVICLRIGACFGSDDRASLQHHFRRRLQRNTPYPYESWQHLSIWISRRDMAQLIHRSIETDAAYGVFHGTSDNHPVVLDISETRRVLGYAPEDSAEEILGEPYGPVGVESDSRLTVAAT